MRLNRLVLITLGGLMLSGPLDAQQYTRGNLTMGFSVSVNSTRLVRDSVKYSSAVLPGVGAGFYSMLAGPLYIHYGIQFSMKGTNNYDTLGNLRTFNFEPFASLQFSPFENIYIEGGAQYSRLMLAQTVKISGSASTGQKRSDIEGFKSSMEYFAGAQINLNKQSKFGFRYYIPYSGTEFRRLEFRLLLIMVEGYTKRKAS
ncbi:MAG: hypothetical protein V2A67_11550 [Bacteroidota bacterium]